MWMPLVDVPPEIGTMTFASGSHLLADLRGTRISDESQGFFADELRRAGLQLDTHGPLAAGDATFHAGWVVHSRAGQPHRPDAARDDGDLRRRGRRVADVIRPGQQLDHDVWVGGLAPGSPLDDRRNPVLWPA